MELMVRLQVASEALHVLLGVVVSICVELLVP